jgi:DMSO/TMAO reductase YedYZ heme-binding membrane subunit
MFTTRLRTHIILAAASLLVLLAAAVIGEKAASLDRVSLISAYLFLFLISVVLLLGPLRTLRTGRVIINQTLRRDIAIWCAFMGLVHLLAGSLESMTPVYLDVFVNHAVNPPSASTREVLFFWSAIAGFIIGILLIVLLALSNNWSLTLIGQRWWKRLHRLSYFAFVLTILHGFGFQVLESRFWGGYALVIVIALVVCIAQVLGIRAVAERAGS